MCGLNVHSKEFFMKDILLLMLQLTRLKQTVRAGWNMYFPPDHRFKTRSITKPESVADHSWNLAMFALAVAEELELDTLKIVWMSLIHDIAELITLDIVTATLDPEEKLRVETEKRHLEDRAMREIFFPMGDWGQRCYQIWLEYADQTSPEAIILKQLDKLEACIQAHIYKEQNQQVDPEEFFDYAAPLLTHPEIAAMLAHLRTLDLKPTKASC